MGFSLVLLAHRVTGSGSNPLVSVRPLLETLTLTTRGWIVGTFFGENYAGIIGTFL